MYSYIDIPLSYSIKLNGGLHYRNAPFVRCVIAFLSLPILKPSVLSVAGVREVLDSEISDARGGACIT